MIFPKNKKAMMDDLFDLLFTVMVAFFALLFIHAALVKGVDDRNKKSLGEMSDVMDVGITIVNQQNLFEKGEDPSTKFDKIEGYKLILPVKSVKREGEVEIIKESSPLQPSLPQSEITKEATPSVLRKEQLR